MTTAVANGKESQDVAAGSGYPSETWVVRPEQAAGKANPQQPGQPAQWMSVVVTDVGKETTVGDADSEALSRKEPLQPSVPLHSGIKERDSALLQEPLHPYPASPASPIRGEEYQKTSGPSSFAVSIEDEKGNILRISRIEGGAGTGAEALVDRPEGLSLQIGEESGQVTLTWVDAGAGRGFVLYRSEKGKEDYAPVSGTIPCFSRDGKETFLYRFTDHSAKPGAQYDYRLEVVKSDQADRTAQRLE